LASFAVEREHFVGETHRQQQSFEYKKVGRDAQVDRLLPTKSSALPLEGVDVSGRAGASKVAAGINERLRDDGICVKLERTAFLSRVV
jgi:hypothetical protein